MLVLITYDVNTTSPKGERRLAHVAKICTNYGQRVQNSVFECIVDSTQFAIVKNQLKEAIDIEKDSIRYYILGEKYKNRIEHIGVQKSFDLSGTLII
ncbi:MAG: CRISPR-associated endonuclease Cas2 [Butyrivibrio sp.]|nr:CRISPR-associated endonuclease Cas2 [Butyrivibrio sp.]